MGIHSNCWGSESDMLLVREVAMMIVMDRLTDKPDWHLKVFDEAIAEKWIQEGLDLPAKPLCNEIIQRVEAVDKQYKAKFLKEWRLHSYKESRYPRRLQTVLDRECMEYVSYFCSLRLSWPTEKEPLRSSVSRSFVQRPKSSNKRESSQPWTHVHL